MGSVTSKLLLQSLLLLASSLALCGCFSTRHVDTSVVRAQVEPVICVLQLRDEKTPLRVWVHPSDILADKMRCYPAVHETGEWPVVLSGWPATFSYGKEWREEASPESVWIELEDVRGIALEELDWPQTLITLPFSLPVGTIDFVVRYGQLGFSAVNNRYDDFSAPHDDGGVTMTATR